MNQIEKFFKKLNKKEQVLFLLILKQVKIDFRKIPNIRKLVGEKDIYRIRVGRYRVIIKASGTKGGIIKIGKRNDNTYKNL